MLSWAQEISITSSISSFPTLGSNWFVTDQLAHANVRSVSKLQPPEGGETVHQRPAGPSFFRTSRWLFPNTNTPKPLLLKSQHRRYLVHPPTLTTGIQVHVQASRRRRLHSFFVAADNRPASNPRHLRALTRFSFVPHEDPSTFHAPANYNTLMSLCFEVPLLCKASPIMIPRTKQFPTILYLSLFAPEDSPAPASCASGARMKGNLE